MKSVNYTVTKLVLLMLFLHGSTSFSLNAIEPDTYPDKCRAPRCVDWILDEKDGDCCPICPTGEFDFFCFDTHIY